MRRESEPAGTPVVSLNGVELVADGVVPEFYRAPAGHIFDDIGAGKTLKLAASDEKGQTSVELPCPDDIELTAPKAGDTLRAGETLTVSWPGDVLAYQPIGLFKPMIEFHRPNQYTGKWSPISNTAANITDSDQNSFEVSVPEATAEQAIALHLIVPGPFVTGPTGNSGICWLVRRIELTLAE